MLTVIPGEFKDPDAVAAEEPFQHLEGVVRAVVDGEISPLPRLPQRSPRAGHQEEEVLLLV